MQITDKDTLHGGKIKTSCNACFHRDACRAWIMHGTTLYKDFMYSTDHCPHFLSEDSIRPKGRWELHPSGDGTCGVCRRVSTAVWDFDSVMSFCPCCGADMREAGA